MNPLRAQIASYIPFSWVDGPGNRFVLFFQGCNFDCLACHNPQTIPLSSTHAEYLTVAEVIDHIRKSMPYISGVTVSGGEATLQNEFVFELFSEIKRSPDLKHLTTFIDSNGSCTQSVWEKLRPVTDGVMLDLKVLDNTAHIALTGQVNGAVLDSIRFLASIGLLYEVRLLLAPGQNDSEGLLIETAHWLLGIDPSMRIKINSFKTHGVRSPASHWADVAEADLLRYRKTLLDAGVLNLI